MGPSRPQTPTYRRESRPRFLKQFFTRAVTIPAPRVRNNVLLQRIERHYTLLRAHVFSRHPPENSARRCLGGSRFGLQFLRQPPRQPYGQRLCHTLMCNTPPWPVQVQWRSVEKAQFDLLKRQIPVRRMGRLYCGFLLLFHFQVWPYLANVAHVWQNDTITNSASAPGISVKARIPTAHRLAHPKLSIGNSTNSKNSASTAGCFMTMTPSPISTATP